MLIAALAVATGGYVLHVYNRLVRLLNYTREAWSGIDVQLKKRHELIPLLMNFTSMPLGGIGHSPLKKPRSRPHFLRELR